MRRFWFYSLCLILMMISALRAEVFTSPDGYRFEVNLKLPKTSIMLGEPTSFDFEIKNLSDVDLGAVFGGDYRNAFGRPESFDVKVVDSKGAVVPKLQLMTMGGMIIPQKIMVGKSFAFRLYLPHWATIEKEGIYKIQVERKQIIAKYNEKDLSGILNSKNSVPIKLSAEIKVIPADHQKLGRVIDEIGKQLVVPDETARKLVPFINDRRIIKYLAAAVEKDYWLMRHLAKFNDETAFKAITRQIDDANQETRRNVSISLSISVHPQAKDYLLKMKNDKYYAIRLDVVHYLGQKKTKDSSELLRQMINDENKMVGDEAKRYLTERGEKFD